MMKMTIQKYCCILTFVWCGWLNESVAAEPVDLDVVYLHNGAKIEGCLISQSETDLSIECVGGLVKIPASLMKKVTRSSPGESAVVLGFQLIGTERYDRAKLFFEKANEYKTWRTKCKEGLQIIEQNEKELELQRKEKERVEIENLIRRKGVAAGITALENRHKEDDEYWGSYRGKLHLVIAKDKIARLNFSLAENHLLMAEKYGADPDEWDRVRKQLVSAQEKSRLRQTSPLAQHRYQGRKKPVPSIPTTAAGFLAAVESARKKGEKVPPVEWLQYVDFYSRENELDPLLVWAIIDTESSWRKDVISSKGAQGLMQLMPLTAEELDVTDPFNPEENIKGGTQYVRFLIEMFDDIDTALAAYNVGPGRVERTGIPPAGKRYIEKVKTRYATLQKRFKTKSITIATSS